MSINTPTEPSQRSGPLGPVVNEPAPDRSQSTHVHGVIWRQPDGRLETKNYSADLPLKGQL